MKKMKKTVIASMSMLVLLTLLGGCTHTSQSEEQSNIDFESINSKVPFRILPYCFLHFIIVKSF